MFAELAFIFPLLTGAVTDGHLVETFNRQPIVSTKRDYNCITLNNWFESRGESFKGKLFVSQVVLNRARSNKFPDSVCNVVYQRKQFSWTHQIPRDKHMVVPKTPIEKRALQEAKLASTIAVLLDEMNIDLTNKAKWYHTVKVTPSWRHNLKVVDVVGSHIFYKTKENT